MSNQIAPVTTTVLGNEKAWTYIEVNQPSIKPGAGMRRVRIIVVNRDGRLTEYREDMGSAKRFKGKRQINIPSLFEHSVDELRAIADDIRDEPFEYLPDLLGTDKYKLG